MDTFIATGYHGTTKSSIPHILDGIDFERNKGDRFLGQGFYLWRDSYKRATKWKGAIGAPPILEKDKAVIRVDVESKITETLNFTSYNYNNERKVIDLFLKQKPAKLSFGEFIDFLIKKYDLSINLIVIADIRKKYTKINVDNITNFVYSDIQICLKNDKCIKYFGEVK